MTLALGHQVHAGVGLSACQRPRLQTQAVRLHHRHASAKPLKSFGRCADAHLLRRSAFNNKLEHSRRSRCQVSRRPVAEAASSAPPAEFKWGADMKNLSISVGLATVVWFIPPPSGVTGPAWHLLAIFLGTIVGIITKPLPLGAVAMLGLGATMLTKTLTFSAAFSAFASEIPYVLLLMPS